MKQCTIELLFCKSKKKIDIVKITRLTLPIPSTVVSAKLLLVIVCTIYVDTTRQTEAIKITHISFLNKKALRVSKPISVMNSNKNATIAAMINMMINLKALLNNLLFFLNRLLFVLYLISVLLFMFANLMLSVPLHYHINKYRYRNDYSI